jgi:hypothetical protein
MQRIRPGCIFQQYRNPGIIVNIVLFNFEGFFRLNPVLQPDNNVQIALQSPRPLAVAQELITLGVYKGDKVGIIGYGFDSFWARLARVKIVAEMLEIESNEFWLGDKNVQQSVLEHLLAQAQKPL